jgi:hypothetical protein
MDDLHLRLTLDVHYTLCGESPDYMKALLRNLTEKAVGEGLLTGETAVVVDDYYFSVESLNG